MESKEQFTGFFNERRPSVRGRLGGVGVVALFASAAVMGAAMPASAASQTWEVRGSGHIWVTSPSDSNGECITHGASLTDYVGANITTLVFSSRTCTDGAGTQCRTTVPSPPDIGRPKFNADTCSWD